MTLVDGPPDGLAVSDCWAPSPEVYLWRRVAYSLPVAWKDCSGSLGVPQGGPPTDLAVSDCWARPREVYLLQREACWPPAVS